MTDMETDGIGDSFDMEVRILGMEAMRVLETTLEKLRERREEQTERAKEAARQNQTRYEAHAALARSDLSPVMGEKFWKDADLDTIRGKYVQARAFSTVDETFAPFRDRIEARAKDLHDLSPEQILAGPVPPGPRPMTDEQLRRFTSEVTPSWYKEWAAQRVKDIDRIRNADRRMTEHARHGALVREDMEHWRDTGTQSLHASKIQEEWLSGDRRSWGHRVDPSETFRRLSDAERRDYGWRPGGPRIEGPLSVDDARLLASTTAPGWYRVQDLVAQDVAPAIRDRLETRLVEDMTRLRDAGRLDTPSAKEEWARFSGHPLTAQGQDPNESLSEFRARCDKTFSVHWELTATDRETFAEPHGMRVGKPMSVAQAEEFAELYAPDWIRDRHKALMDEVGMIEDPDRAAWAQTSNREQFRYAMEEARDTGALSHPYAAALRSQAAMLGVDESEGMRHVPSTERMRFGGPEARPLSKDEALEVMAGWAPDWYKDQVNRMLRPSEMIDASAQRVTVDAVRADMTTLRDRGVLSSDHAQRLWAASQPGFDPSDPDSRKAMDRRERLWVETAGTRAGPKPMDPNNRERLGGHADAPQTPQEPQRAAVVAPVAPAPTQGAERPQERPREPQERHHRPQDRQGREAREVPAPDRPKGPVWDSVERRERDARTARAAGFSPDAVDGMTATDYGHSRKPKGKASGRPPQFEEWRERAAQQAREANRPKGRDR